MTGQLSGGRATGTLHVVGVRRRSGRSQTCAQRPNRAFEVRFAGPPAGAPAQPLPRAFYAGTSSYEIFDRIQAPVILRATKDAKKVAARWTIAAKCGQRGVAVRQLQPGDEGARERRLRQARSASASATPTGSSATARASPGASRPTARPARCGCARACSTAAASSARAATRASAPGTPRRRPRRLPAVRTLTRPELTAALAARQGLIERARISPAEAIRRLTPLQGQHPPAPYIALAARLDGFTRADLEAALVARSVVKTTLMRMTLHLAAADDYPAYAQLVRQVRMRTLAQAVPAPRRGAGRPPSSAPGSREPRTNEEIRERVWALRGRQRRDVDADHLRPRPAPARAAPAGRALGRPPPAELRRRPAPAARPGRRGHARALALPRRVRAREPPRRRRPGPASPSATSPRRGSAWRRSSTATSTARRCSTSPGSRCRPPRRRCRRGCSPTGTSRCSPTPTASASSRPRCSRSS